jgi:CO/xanthine dehydrogenase Mo-binding subunit
MDGTHFSGAAVLELTAAEGKPRIERIVIAVDCGRVISFGILDRQIEGGVLFAVSTALKGEIVFSDGAVCQSNFHDYPRLRLAGAPVVEKHVVSGGRLINNLFRLCRHGLKAEYYRFLRGKVFAEWREVTCSQSLGLG